MDQHSPEWWAARCGKVTASRIGDLMARNQPHKGQTVGDWSAKRQHYLDEKVAEIITGKPRDRKKVASLDHRLELEPDARSAYEFYRDVEIDLVGFVEHPTIPRCGASPDGLLGSDGCVEIKCPDSETHINTWLGKVVDRGYILQMQFGMACTGRQWWDFVSFDPNMPEELKLYVQRVERDDQLIAEIETNVIEFLAEVDQKVEQVRALMRGSTPLEAVLESSLQSLGVH